MNNWQKVFPPPENGWHRLSEKLAMAEEEQRMEIRFWKGLTAAAILVFLLLTLKERPEAEGAATIFANEPVDVTAYLGNQPIPVAGMPQGIHFYWVFRNSTLR